MSETAHLLACPAERGRSSKVAWLKYPAAIALLALGAYLGTGAVAWIADSLGGFPQPGSMRERPFW